MTSAIPARRIWRAFCSRSRRRILKDVSDFLNGLGVSGAYLAGFMVDSDGLKGDALPEPEISRLRDLRLRLLHLHKSLLELERVNFEKTFGRVDSGELLQLVINHPQFAWLRIISALVVEIDEMLNGDEPTTLSDIRSLFA